MIDPLAAIIKYAGSDAALALLIEGRIAEKHKFGLASSDGWTAGQKALVIRDDPGSQPDIDTEVHVGRLEARCYGERPSEAKRIYLELVRICRDLNKATILTSNGTALIYWLVMDSSPMTGIDPDVNLDMVAVSLRYSVHEQPLENYA
jgi:hypothetical protein